MRFPNVILALCVCGAGGVAAAEPPPLTPAEMQPVLRALQTQYARLESTGTEAINQAALDSLLKSHPDTIQLVTVADTVPAPAPLLIESLTPQIACVRPGAFRQEDVAPLKDALTKLAAAAAATLILDLRSAAQDADPAVAASFAALFLPKDTPLFTLTSPVKTASDPVWTRDMMVLIDRETGNAGEILAAVLQAKHRAFLIGTASRGRTAVISSLPVRKMEGGNLVLRYTAQRVIFAGGDDPFGKGVTPDMAVPVNPEARRAALAPQSRAGLAASVFHPSRPRSNEASLVARTNLELPERIARTARQPVEYDQQVTDRPLQLAVDIIIANFALETPKR